MGGLRVHRLGLATALLATALAVTATAARAATPTLEAGVGRSDITPPTGFATFGYVRDDGIARGQHTRLQARAIVLAEGARRLAIVTIDLGATPGGLLAEVATRVAPLGLSERSIIISASHTHSGPAGFSTFQADNFVAPTQGDLTHFKTTGDPHLYGFLVERVTLAIVRAARDLAPARVGWGSSTLTGVTDNRSLEAHLADFGIDEPYGTGRVSQDPGGYLDTIDPRVDVLRVDRVAQRRTIPLGGWLDFADHGTVDPYQFGVYNADHTGVASRLFEGAVRRAGHVPAGQDVVGAYGNSDAGDMTAALRGRGPAYAQTVGQHEASAMLAAWREAGRRMSGAPALDIRWTRSCFCGRTVDGGAVDSRAIVGLPFVTGSEENRGPLYDVTQTNFEGLRLPVGVGPQSRKIPAVPPPIADFPTAVPLMAVRLGSRLIVTIPGEATVEMGRRIRSAVLSAGREPGVDGVVLAGYANEFVHYFTTPEEYDQQHYEGGNTLYGKFSGNLIMDDLATLAGDLARGTPAPQPVAFDPRNGVVPDTTPYGPGAGTGTITAQPSAVARMARAQLRWSGGPRGLDRPLDSAFVTIERRGRRSWRPVTDDLGLQIVWRVDDAGGYSAQWQVPIDQRPGSYRFVVSANRYTLTSQPFAVAASRALTPAVVGRRGTQALVTLRYPPIEMLADLLSRPSQVIGGTISLRPGRRRIVRDRAGVFALPAGATIAAGAARDRYGNTNAAPLTLPR